MFIKMRLTLLNNNIVLLLRILFLMVISSFQLFSQNNLVNEAIEAYNNKDYQKSINIYSELLTANSFSPELYYNLGDSYFKIGDYGNSLLYFEKALKYQPKNENIIHNIYVVKRKIDSEIIELPDFFLKRWWDSLTNLLSLEVWSILSILFALLTIVVVYVYWFNKGKYKFVSKGVVLILFLLFFISLAASYKVKNRIYNSNNRILIHTDSLFSAPDLRSDLLYKLEPGEKFYTIDSIDTWYRVKLLNKELGWINKKNCKKI